MTRKRVKTPQTGIEQQRKYLEKIKANAVRSKQYKKKERERKR